MLLCTDGIILSGRACYFCHRKGGGGSESRREEAGLQIPQPGHHILTTTDPENTFQHEKWSPLIFSIFFSRLMKTPSVNECFPTLCTEIFEKRWQVSEVSPWLPHPLLQLLPSCVPAQVA